LQTLSPANASFSGTKHQAQPGLSQFTSAYSVQLGERVQVTTAANLFRKLCYENKEQLMAGVIVAGWDKYNGGSVYNIPLGGSLHRSPYAIGGSGSTYIFGYCDSQWRPGMTAADAERFVTNSLALAMARDGSSGGVIRLATINEAGIERKLVAGKDIPTFWKDYPTN
jgi:20S proteasome subunit beta 1